MESDQYNIVTQHIIILQLFAQVNLSLSLLGFPFSLLPPFEFVHLSLSLY